MIRPALAPDHPAIEALGTSTFARFGAYGGAIAQWLANPGMETLVDAEGDRVDAFVTLAIVDSPERHGYIVAIGVAAQRRRSGLGRALLVAAIGRLCAAAATFEFGEVRATVAADNPEARALFEGQGFVVRADRQARPFGSGPAGLTLVRPIH